MNLKILILVVGVLCENAASDGYFTIIFSQVMELGEPFTVLVSAQDYRKTPNIGVQIIGELDNGGNFQKNHNITLKNNRIERIVFDMKNQPLGNYFLQAISYTGEKFNYSANLHLSTKKFSVFIQTDKAIYKPSDLVQFRVLVVDSETRPTKVENIEIFITDGAQNRIMQLENPKFTSGVFQGSLQLSDQPVLGDWTINVQVDNSGLTTQTFEVAEYVLPKFQVIVSSTPKLEPGEKIIVSYSAQYTYGKTLDQGTATITVAPLYNWYGQNFTSVTIVKPLNGDKNTVKINPAKDMNIKNIDFQVDVQITVSIKDALTGQEENTSTTVSIYSIIYTLDIQGSNYFKPGLPSPLTITGQDLDGNPIDDKRTPVIINVTYTYDEIVPGPPFPGPPFPGPIPLEDDVQPANEARLVRPIGPIIWRPPNYVQKTETIRKHFCNGTAEFTLKNIPENVTSISIVASYKGSTAYFYSSSRLSESNQYIEIEIATKSLSINRGVDINVISNVKLHQIFYVVTARGKILWSSSLDALNSKKFSFKFLPSPEMAPDAKIVVFYITKGGEIISDSADLDFGDDLSNYVDLTVPEQLGPGDNATFTVKSLPNSLVALLGVDQSVLLLKSGNDIEQSAVSAELNTYGQIDRYNFEYWDNSYTSYYTDFSLANAYIITNANPQYQQPFIFRPGVIDIAFANAGAVGAPVAVPAPAPVNPNPAPPSAADVTIRKDFPETWLFESFNNDRGTTNITRTVPQSITSWIITGFSLSKTQGLGLTKQPSKLTVFQPFFVSLNLPYSVKNGEVVAIQVIVFNYLSSTQQAQVTLYNSLSEFEFIEGTPTDSQRTLNVSVASESGASVSFLVRPIKVGDMTIKVIAISATAGDGLEDQLIVEPEGVTQYVNNAVFIDLRNVSEFNTNISINIPSNAVPDSTRITASAIGDILGPSLSNLDNLIQLPSGCGEQNMLNFVPDIVVIEYLTTVGKLTADIKLKATSFMQSGYQRELTYKRDDGSFSAFGNSDKSGSTWLTAFVVKSFRQASSYIFVDQTVITQALGFLASVQAADGSFPEVGQVIHTDMQGGSSKGLALTAYTLNSFLVNQDAAQTYNNTINKATNYIAQNIGAITDVYTLAIVAYTFQLLNHTLKDSLLAQLDGQAIVLEGMKHWEQPGVSTDPFNDYQPDSINTELTAYALLAYSLAGRDTDMIEIAKWLITQRNAQGGFQSTQDTVVGLTALSVVAAKIYVANSNIDITLTYNSNQKTSFSLNAANSLVLQIFELPSNVTSVAVNAKGSGFSILQISYQYNILEVSNSPRFSLSIDVQSGSANGLTLHVCASYIPNASANSSNMAVIEAQFPSGFTFDTDSSAGLTEDGTVQRVETKNGGTIAVLYFNKLTSNATCVDIKAISTSGVAEQKPSWVAVYDYYDSTKRVTKFYDPPSITVSDL